MKKIIPNFKTVTTIKEIKLNLEEVKQIYSGKPDMCYCGCSGKYTYKTEPKKLEKLFNKLIKDTQTFENIDDEIFTKEIGNTVYSIYLKD